jgi:hypothetical protein
VSTCPSIGLRLKLGMASSIKLFIKAQKVAKDNPVDVEFDFP